MTKYSNHSLSGGNRLRLLKIATYAAAVIFFISASAAPPYPDALPDLLHTKVTLSVKDKTIKEAFEQIEKETSFRIVYSDDQLDTKKRVSLSLSGATIDKVMEELLKDTGNSYEISGRQIIVTKSGQSQNPAPAASSQASVIRVTGRITDEEGNELVGTGITEKGTSHSSVSNIDGTYLIDVAPGAQLTYSHPGFLSQDIPVNNRTVIDVVMELDTRQMEEVVVVGFGTQKKESVVGAIQSISYADMRLPTTNLSNTFAGRVAGIISVQRSGEPGADGASFWIRGIGTFAGGTAQTPLILIDGIESSSYDLNALAPEVIDNFSVLKDATATALYGSRGANGVMIITTRSGVAGKPRINVRLEGRLSTPTQVPELADGVQYMEMFNEAILTRNPNGARQFSDAQIAGTRDNLDPYLFPNVNWYNELFKNLTFQETVNLNVSGGVANRVSYFMSATMTNESGLIKEAEENPFKNNIQNIRYSMQSNVGVQLTKTTSVGVKLNIQVQDYKSPVSSTDNLFGRVMWAPPTLYPVRFPSDEGAEYIKWGNKLGGPQANRYANPVAEMAAGLNERFSTTVMAAFNLEQKLDFVTRGLSFTAMYSLKNYTSTNAYKQITPYYFEVDQTTVTQDPDTGVYTYSLSAVNTDGTNSAWASGSYTGDRLMNMHASLNYEREFGLHDVSGQLIYMQRAYYTNSPGSNYNASLGERYQGIAGRATYNFDRRYYAEFNFGYNGSDSFQKGKRFGFFPSIAAGYVVSNEEFFPKNKILSFLKLRASYGEVGNTYTSERFPGYTTVNMSGGSYTFGDDFNDTKTGAIITRYGDPNATWEVARKTNIGLELGFFNDRLLIITDVFREKRDRILLARQTVPSTVGIGSATPYANIGKVNNQGLDMSLEYNHQVNKNLLITGRANLTYAVNELVFRDEPEYEWDYQYQRGNSLNRIGPGYISLGLFVDQDDIDNSPSQTAIMSNIRPGDIKYQDLNGDGVVDQYDQTYFGMPTVPQIVYGFGLSVKYRKWDFSVFFQGVDNVSIYMSGIHPFGAYYQNVLGFVADSYWSESNPDPNATYPRLANTEDFQNTQQVSTYWLRNGAFLRLKNLEVGYEFQHFRFYVSGSNLLTFSGFKLWDPELGTNNGLKYPLQRIINLGIQFNL